MRTTAANQSVFLSVKLWLYQEKANTSRYEKDSGGETVKSVIYDFVSGEVEISVIGIDKGNEYGKCLYDNNG